MTFGFGLLPEQWGFNLSESTSTTIAFIGGVAGSLQWLALLLGVVHWGHLSHYQLHSHFGSGFLAPQWVYLVCGSRCDR
jgi:hypothetical protein